MFRSPPDSLTAITPHRPTPLPGRRCSMGRPLLHHPPQHHGARGRPQQVAAFSGGVAAEVTRQVLLSGRMQRRDRRAVGSGAKNAGADWTIVRPSWFAQKVTEGFFPHRQSPPARSPCRCPRPARRSSTSMTSRKLPHGGPPPHRRSGHAAANRRTRRAAMDLLVGQGRVTGRGSPSTTPRARRQVRPCRCRFSGAVQCAGFRRRNRCW